MEMSEYVDIRDMIERYEELEDDESLNEEDTAERDALKELLDDLRSNGGETPWRGDWYPVTLIRDDLFMEYAKELAEDIGAIVCATLWPCTCIDWEKAVQELQADYSSVEYDGDTYWYR